MRLFSKEEMVYIFELREVLEGLDARRTAARITDSQIKKLTSFFQPFADQKNISNYKGYAREDRRFHNFVIDVGAKEFLKSILLTTNIISFSYQVLHSEGLRRVTNGRTVPIGAGATPDGIIQGFFCLLVEKEPADALLDRLDCAALAVGDDGTAGGGGGGRYRSRAEKRLRSCLSPESPAHDSSPAVVRTTARRAPAAAFTDPRGQARINVCRRLRGSRSRLRGPDDSGPRRVRRIA